MILTQYFSPEITAPSYRFDALIRELVGLGHEVEVVTAMPNHPTGAIFSSYRGKFYIREGRESTIIHRLWLIAATGDGLSRLFNYLSFTITSLVGLWRSRKPDFIFVESPSPTLIVPAWISSVLWRRPIIFNVADLWPDALVATGVARHKIVRWALRTLERWAYRRSRYVTAVTDGIRERLVRLKGLSPEKVFLLPNGVTEIDADESHDHGLATKYGLVGKTVFTYAGTLGYPQRLETLLEAMALLQKQDAREICLVIVGGGSQRETLHSLAKELSLHNVVFIDPQPMEFVVQLYSLTRAGLVCVRSGPEFLDARPSKLLTIMSCGRAVIYSGAGEGAELVRQANAGVVLPPEKPEQIANAMRKLANDEEKALNYGLHGRDFVQKHLTWRVLAANWLDQLERAEMQRKIRQIAKTDKSEDKNTALVNAKGR